MSIITVLALISISLLVVVVLAACTSFPNHSTANDDLPDGDWVGEASFSRKHPMKVVVGTGHNAQSAKRPLKMHSWI